MSLFFVDSSCDLDSQQIKSLGIECFNLPYVIDGKEKLIADDFEYTKFYSKIRKGIELKYLPLSEKEYENVFEPALKSGDDIVYVYSTSKVLDCKNLFSARDKLLNKYPDRKFNLIDSKNFSAGHASVCFMLAMKYRSGRTVDEIVEDSYDVIDSIACYMIVDSLEQISKHGALETNAVVGTALNIKSILAVDIDGRIRLVEKVSGRKRALNKLIQIVRQTGKNIADNQLVICNSHATEDSKFIADTLKSYMGDDLKVLEQNISPSNTAVVGNNVISIAFHVYKKMH